MADIFFSYVIRVNTIIQENGCDARANAEC
jgi:hypothetical protein